MKESVESATGALLALPKNCASFFFSPWVAHRPESGLNELVRRGGVKAVKRRSREMGDGLNFSRVVTDLTQFPYLAIE